MPERRRYSLDGAAAEFALASSRADQKRILAACQRLRDFPDTSPDFTRRDAVGRTIAVKTFRPFLIHYGDDFADRVVRIVRIERFS
jgi:hypothetical protein